MSVMIRGQDRTRLKVMGDVEAELAVPAEDAGRCWLSFSDGTLIVGEGARVKAEIAVDTVIVQGEVVGNIRAKTGVELHAPGRLRGNMQAGTLVVQKGAIFDGNCVMEGREGAQRPTPPVVPPAPGQ